MKSTNKPQQSRQAKGASKIMSNFQSIDADIWTDPWFIDLPDDSHRLFFLWLIANPHKNTTGIYEIHPKVMANLSGFSPKKCQRMLELYAKFGKVFYENGWIILKNRHKFTNFNNEKVRAFVIEHLTETIPNSIQINHQDIIKIMLDKAGYTGVRKLRDISPVSLKKREREREIERKVKDPPLPPQGGDKIPETEISEPKKPIPPEIQELLDHAQSVVNETIDEVKASGVMVGKKENHCVLLNDGHMQSLVERNNGNMWMVKAMLSVYYQWKTIDSPKIVKSDFLSILKPWVQDRAYEYLKINPPTVDERDYWSVGTMVTTRAFEDVLIPLAKGNVDLVNEAILAADEAWRESADKRRKSVNYVSAIIRKRLIS